MFLFTFVYFDDVCDLTIDFEDYSDVSIHFLYTLMMFAI